MKVSPGEAFCVDSDFLGYLRDAHLGCRAARADVSRVLLS